MRREIESVRARDPATELSCVRFGERALRLAPEDLEGASSTSAHVPAASGGEESGDASELARALELAAELARAAHAGGGRIVILGDGGFTGVDPPAALDELARAGFEIEARRLPRATIDDLALDDLQAPRFVREGEACLVRAGLWLAAADDAPRDARIDVRIESAAGARELSFDSPLPPGSARDSSGCAHWSAPLALGVLEPGWNRVELRARIVEHDRERGSERADADSGNDSLSLSIACGERPLVLLAGRAGPALESLESELRASALVTPARVEPRALRSPLASADVLVTAGLEAEELPLDDLAAWLRSGGGWLAFADERLASAFVADELARGAFALLPLVPPRRSPPPRELVFLLDASGSMSGPNQAALEGAILALIGRLDSAERLELRFFAADLGAPLVHAGGGANAREERARLARELVAARPPGGPTHLLEALDSWRAARAPAASEALVFVFSDGRQSGAEASSNARAAVLESARELSRALAASRARVCCIATGSPCDEELLSALQTPRAPLEHASELDSPAASERLGRFLARQLAATRRSGLGEHAVVPAAREPLTQAQRDWLDAQLAARALPWPACADPLVAELASGARALWRSDSGSPLLAVGDVGLGHSAACAFEPGGDSAPRWTDARLFVPLVQGLARAPRERGTWVELRDGRLRLHAASLPARVRARVAPADAPSSIGARELWLEPGDEVADWASERSAPWPEDLAPSVRRVRVDLDLDPPLTRLVELERAPEDRFPRRSLDMGDLGHAGAPELASSAARPPAAGDRRAELAFALSLGLLCAAGLLGLPGRGFGR